VLIGLSWLIGKVYLTPKLRDLDYLTPLALKTLKVLAVIAALIWCVIAIVYGVVWIVEIPSDLF